MQNKYIGRIDAILAAAGLKAVGYSLALQATQAIQSSPGEPELTLCADAQGVSLMVTAADGSAACIRTLKDVIDGGDKGISINEKALGPRDSRDPRPIAGRRAQGPGKDSRLRREERVQPPDRRPRPAPKPSISRWKRCPQRTSRRA